LDTVSEFVLVHVIVPVALSLMTSGKPPDTLMLALVEDEASCSLLMAVAALRLI
jgi:hypothetical protein